MTRGMERAFAATSVAIAVFVASWGGTALALRWLASRAIVDRPVARSSHSTPVPRGAGLAVVPALAAGAAALAVLGTAPPGITLIVGMALALGALSWRDDLGGLPIALRFAAHAAAVAIALAFWPGGLVFQGALPAWLDRVAGGLLWLWFVELYNFMDGIDGITGVETASLGIGMALVPAVAGVDGDGAAALALAAAAAALGFLCWNWHPARIFLGDVGSVPLGFVMGWLLLLLAGKGLWAPALLLPLYYLADASLTLLGRIARRERFWHAHRKHFYQRALGSDGDHAAVARLILGVDVVLIALALGAIARPLPALALGAVVVAGFLARLEWRARHAR